MSPVRYASSRASPKTVLIAQTGWGRDEDRERSRAAGFDYHLVKPIDHERRLTALFSMAKSRSCEYRHPAKSPAVTSHFEIRR